MLKSKNTEVMTFTKWFCLILMNLIIIFMHIQIFQGPEPFLVVLSLFIHSFLLILIFKTIKNEKSL